MIKLVIITNILTPYRQNFFDVFDRVAKDNDVKLHVFAMSNTEHSRDWMYHDLARDYTELLEKRVFVGREDSMYYSPNLCKRLNEIKPDIIVLAGSYTLFPVWQALRWAKYNKRKVLFWSESHLDETRSMNKVKYFVRDIIRKVFYGTVDGFWYPGEKARRLIDKYSNPGKIYIQVPNMVDGDRLLKKQENIKMSTAELREKYGLSSEKRIFFSPARLIPVKGFEEFLEAIKDTTMKDRFQIAIAGDGELRERIMRLAIKEQIDVVLLGHRNADEVAELFKASDFMLLPSISDANPLVCIEALWCGKPLLVSEHVGNYPEVVDEGVNGYVFSYKKMGDALEKLECMVVSGTIWRREAEEKSMGLANEQFDICRNCKKMVNDIVHIARSF